MGIVEVLGRPRRLMYIRADLTKAFWRTGSQMFSAPDFTTFEGDHYAGPKRVFKIWHYRSGRGLLKAFYDKYNGLRRFTADFTPLDPKWCL